MHLEKANVKHQRHSRFKWTSTVYIVTCLLATVSFTPRLFAQTTSREVSTEEQNTALVKAAEHSEILYNMLVADMAYSRRMKEESLSHALLATEKSQDPAIASYTTELAIEFQSPEPALQSAEIWAKNAKNNLQAQMVAATLLIGQSIDKAIPYLTQALTIEPLQVYQHLSTIQSRLSERSAEHLKMALQIIAKNRPNDAYAQLVAGQSTAQQGEIPKAYQWVDQALKLNPSLTPAIQLKARLMRYEDNSDTRALKYLTETVTKFSSNSELRLFLASALMDANRLNDAVLHLNKLTNDTTFGGQAKLFLGEIYLVENKTQKSKELLQQALMHKEVADNAMYDLGELAEKQNNPEEAIQRYSSVNPGPFHVPATLRAVFILKKNKNFTQALQVLHDATPTTVEEQKQLLLSEVDILAINNQLEEASELVEALLEKLPEDIDILLSHSMIASKQKNWKVAENDLKNILIINPNQADALNALGYLLLMQNDRLEEAKNYLSQAIKLNPKNPSYLDSLGWLEYKMGHNKTAITLLEQAQVISQDPDITVHLGEVLWVSGQQKEALVHLNNAYKKDPSNKLLQETVQRLKINSPVLKVKPMVATDSKP